MKVEDEEEVDDEIEFFDFWWGQILSYHKADIKKGKKATSPTTAINARSNSTK